eukprot:10862730-Alexandrium_andersonii.AAC.1
MIVLRALTAAMAMAAMSSPANLRCNAALRPALLETAAMTGQPTSGTSRHGPEQLHGRLAIWPTL